MNQLEWSYLDLRDFIIYLCAQEVGKRQTRSEK